MIASARSRLSTRRDETISERERGGERPACSCHSGVRPRGQTYKPGMCPCARESHRSPGERPKALWGWAVVGGGGERRLTGQMMKWRSTMEARTSQHALTTLLPLPCWLVARLQAQLAGLALQLPDVFLSGFQTSRRVSVTHFDIGSANCGGRNYEEGKESVTFSAAWAVGTITGRILSGGAGPWAVPASMRH